MFVPDGQPHTPRNLLIVDGALEAAMLREQGLRTVSAAAGKQAEAGVTYGSFADGSARRIVFARGVEHIGVLYSGDALREAGAWFDAAFERAAGEPVVDTRGPWLGLLFLGVIALAWPLSALLPRVATAPAHRIGGWRLLLPLALAPAVLTPVLLWKLPIAFLPLLLGDYLAMHFLVYGLLTALACVVVQKRLALATAPRSEAAQRTPFVLATLALAGFSFVAVIAPIDTWVFSVLPAPWRLPLVGALFVGTLAWFLADERLTRRLLPLRGAYEFTKLCFLLSLVFAIALNLQKLFFLVIIVPAILLLFAVYGLFSAWSNQRTGHPWPAAIAHALVFAWLIGMTFPVVG
jgi:hypothetical protein